MNARQYIILDIGDAAREARYGGLPYDVVTSRQMWVHEGHDPAAFDEAMAYLQSSGFVTKGHKLTSTGARQYMRYDNERDNPSANPAKRMRMDKATLRDSQDASSLVYLSDTFLRAAERERDSYEQLDLLLDALSIASIGWRVANDHGNKAAAETAYAQVKAAYMGVRCLVGAPRSNPFNLAYDDKHADEMFRGEKSADDAEMAAYMNAMWGEHESKDPRLKLDHLLDAVSDASMAYALDRSRGGDGRDAHEIYERARRGIEAMLGSSNPRRAGKGKRKSLSRKVRV